MVSEKIRGLYNFLVTFETVNIASSIISNIILIYLIVYRSHKSVGAYRYILLAFTINDIYFPVIHYLTMPVICSYQDAFIMFSHGILNSKNSICLFACTFSQTMPLLAHLFIYRVIATTRSSYLQFYNARSCLILIAITLGLESSLWFFLCYFFYGSDQEMRNYVQPFLIEFFEGDGSAFIGALYYGNDGTFRFRAFLATMGFNAIMFICIFIIVICSFAIVSHFRKANVQWSGKTRQLQKQLFNTLFVQTVIPMIFVYLPCALVINLPMLGWRIALFPNIISSSVTIFPLFDAFVIIFGVKSYRQSVLLGFKCITRQSVNDSSASNVGLPNSTMVKVTR